jgi:hypothetical protein
MSTATDHSSAVDLPLPNPTSLLLYAAAFCFSASLLYAIGVSSGLEQPLLGYFDIQDFVRLTP